MATDFLIHWALNAALCDTRCVFTPAQREELEARLVLRDTRGVIVPLTDAEQQAWEPYVLRWAELQGASTTTIMQKQLGIAQETEGPPQAFTGTMEARRLSFVAGRVVESADGR